MPYFFSGQKLSLGKEVEITGEEAGHILLSHRVKKGEKIKLQDPEQNRFLSEVVSAAKKALNVKAVEVLSVPPEPKIPVTLFQAFVSEKALDFIFQKGTELGLNRIVLFNSANTAAKLTKEVYEKKFFRWNKILAEAAKQSERVTWPVLEFAESQEVVLNIAKKFDIIVLTDVSGQQGLTLDSMAHSIGLVVGPEGGFTAPELAEFKAWPNIHTVSLGSILLRADTAVLAALAIIRNLTL